MVISFIKHTTKSQVQNVTYYAIEIAKILVRNHGVNIFKNYKKKRYVCVCISLYLISVYISQAIQ